MQMIRTRLKAVRNDDVQHNNGGGIRTNQDELFGWKTVGRVPRTSLVDYPLKLLLMTRKKWENDGQKTSGSE
jgi:hypothetical protein